MKILLFHMTGAGMEVGRPVHVFLQDRDPAVRRALCMAVAGQRPFAVEVQPWDQDLPAIPRRPARASMPTACTAAAVIERSCRLNLGGVDIYAQIGGGMKLAYPSLTPPSSPRAVALLRPRLPEAP
jgi:DNA repair protein RadA/Sms